MENKKKRANQKSSNAVGKNSELDRGSENYEADRGSENYEVEIIDIGHDGEGIGKLDGLTVFVRGSVSNKGFTDFQDKPNEESRSLGVTVGDIVKVRLTQKKKNFAKGTVVEMIKPSPYRQDPNCIYFGECGGCSIRNLTYEKQLEFKEKRVVDNLKRIGKCENPKVAPILGMTGDVHSLRYRNKAQIPVYMDKVGFYKKGSHEIVDCETCMIQNISAEQAATAMRKYAKEAPSKNFRHLIVRTTAAGDVMIILVVKNKIIMEKDLLIQCLEESVDNLKSVILNINPNTTSEIMGDTYITIYGKDTMTETIGDLTFEISPMSFYQVNHGQMIKLYDKALEYADLTGKETILDLYCGVGTIGLSMAKYAKQVIGIESVEGAIADANRNAISNGIINGIFICGKAEEVLKIHDDAELAEIDEDGETEKCSDGASAAGIDKNEIFNEQEMFIENEIFDEQEELEEIDSDNGDIRLEMLESALKSEDLIAVLDPPRKGCDKRLLEALIETAPKKIIYISCDPATLSRDIAFLTQHEYALTEATPIDMFAHTTHVETVVLLERNPQ